MTKNNASGKKSERLQIAKIGAWQGIIVALIAAIGAGLPAYLAGRQQGRVTSVTEPSPLRTEPSPPPSQESRPEVTTYIDAGLEEKIKHAKTRVWAIGTKLTPFEQPLVEHLIERINNDPPFEVQMVLSNPSSNNLKKRIEAEQPRDLPEEERNARAQRALSDAQKEIRIKLSWLHDLFTRKVHDDTKKHLIVRCSDVYPSIAVIVIDKDLYTYSYPYGETAARSVVIGFRNYEDNQDIRQLAEFFERHLKSVVKDASKKDFGKCK